MSRMVPALRGRMGNMDYYILTLKAASLSNYIRTPKEMAGWEMRSIEEKYQREINIKRVKDQIARYWAENPSHFFGSIIVAPADFKAEIIAGNFEPLDDIFTKNLPKLYRDAARNMGFLTIPDETILVPLDGQHRVKAIEFAINGKDSDGKELTGFKSKTALGDEDISVLLVAVDNQKARSIFTHVNRYAKPTTAGQNYITSDDDILAVIARKIANKKISARLVKYDASTLKRRDEHFTTLSTIYNCMEAIAKSHCPRKIDTTTLPPKDVQALLQTKANEVWDVLLTRIDAFRDSKDDPEESGDDRRIEIRQDTLLGRPVTQECLFRAFLRLTKSPTNLSNDVAADRLNKLPWTMSNVEDLWQNVLWRGAVEKGKMITKNRNLASDFIFYLAGGRMSEAEKDDLLDKYREQFPESSKPDKLPVLPK